MRQLVSVAVLCATAYNVGNDCGGSTKPADGGASASDSGSDAGFPDAGVPDGGTLDAGVPISVVTLAAGGASACALISTGTVKCWGANDQGQLGDGTTSTSPTPHEVHGLSDAVAVSVGIGHACALLDGGTVWCWGNNGVGQLGNGTRTSSLLPVAVTGIQTATAISVGSQTNGSQWAHSCALLDGGSVKCWGDNNWGELGDGTTTNRSLPVAVTGVAGAVAIAASGADTCALLPAGTVSCWGTDNQNELTGAGGVSQAVSLFGSSTGDSFLVIQDGSALVGWGHDSDGQLGDGTTGSDQGTPVEAQGIATATAAAVEGWTFGVTPGHGCALLADHSIRCWADNNWGQLGDGMSVSSLTPVAVTGIHTATALAVGSDAFSCAALQDGTVECWGNGDAGELGAGVPSSSLPVAVPGLP